MSDTRAVIDEYWTRHRAQDEAVCDLFAEEVEFYIPGELDKVPWSGYRTRGGRELLPAFRLMWEHWAKLKGSYRNEPTLVVEGEHGVFVAKGVHHEVERDGKVEVADLDVVIHFTVQEGKLTRMYVIENNTALEREG